MVQVVLEGGVDDGVVGREPRELMAPMEVRSVPIKKNRKCDEQHIHIDRNKKRDDQKRATTHKLIYIFICDHSEGTRVEEDVMGTVEVPLYTYIIYKGSRLDSRGQREREKMRRSERKRERD